MSGGFAASTRKVLLSLGFSLDLWFLVASNLTSALWMKLVQRSSRAQSSYTGSSFQLPGSRIRFFPPDPHHRMVKVGTWIEQEIQSFTFQLSFFFVVPGCSRNVWEAAPSGRQEYYTSSHQYSHSFISPT
ncbi:hypothetical protein AMECASPLE_032381 [Ameca splendens]|uniref:Secreted protein n=1 Tax=Ameca splendens TaxID=208324 RepID=A0ABV0YIA5_9TELE